MAKKNEEVKEDKKDVKPYDYLMGKQISISTKITMTDIISGTVIQENWPVVVLEYHQRKTIHRNIINLEHPSVKDISTKEVQSEGKKLPKLLGSLLTVEVEYPDIREQTGTVVAVEGTRIQFIDVFRGKLWTYWADLNNHSVIGCEVTEKIKED